MGTPLGSAPRSIYSSVRSSRRQPRPGQFPFSLTDSSGSSRRFSCLATGLRQYPRTSTDHDWSTPASLPSSRASGIWYHLPKNRDHGRRSPPCGGRSHRQRSPQGIHGDALSRGREPPTSDGPVSSWTSWVLRECGGRRRLAGGERASRSWCRLKPWSELKEIATGCGSALPKPGSGGTTARFRAFADWAERDLSLARLAEGHLDALAILAEAGLEPIGG